jgi:hypothetical protein
MADDRTYIRVHDGLDEHPKVEGLSDGAFRLLLTSWMYCSRNRTDGQIKDAAWKRRGTAKARRELLEAGLVEQCEGRVEMHDYLEHQRSAEEIRLLKETRGDTGSFGNHVRWHVVRRKPKKDCEHCFPIEASDRKPIANAIAKPSQTDRKPIASTEAEAEAEAEDFFRGVSHVSNGSDDEPPLFPDRCHKHGNTYEPGNCGNCADVRKTNLRLASIGPHNPATKPHCGECDETRMLRTRFGAIPCPNCNPAAEAS